MLRTRKTLFSRTLLLLAAILTLTSTASLAAAKKSPNEYLRIKSGLIYNFLKLTEWPEEPTEGTYEQSPEEKTQEQSAPQNLHVCLLGGDPFEGILGLLSGHTAQKRVITIEERKNPYFINGCDLVFINSNEEKNIEDILKTLDKKPILTVSDIPGFARRGGMVEIAKNNKRQIYLDINVKAIEQTDLRVKEDFLRMAGIVWLK